MGNFFTASKSSRVTVRKEGEILSEDLISVVLSEYKEILTVFGRETKGLPIGGRFDYAHVCKKQYKAALFVNVGDAVVYLSEKVAENRYKVFLLVISDFQAHLDLDDLLKQSMAFLDNLDKAAQAAIVLKIRNLVIGSS